MNFILEIALYSSYFSSDLLAKSIYNAELLVPTSYREKKIHEVISQITL